jgi:thiol-disulfide isomerase/thioredoxin
MGKRKLWKIGLTLVSVGVLLVGIHFYSTLNFSGNGSVNILDPSVPYSNLDDVLADKKFRDKVVYVDLWGTHCVPCIQEFKYLTNLKDRFHGKDVAFLYIATTYEKVDDRYRWKKFIDKQHLEGYNVFAELPLFNDIWGRLESKKENRYMIPRYFIVDKSGSILNTNAHRPSSGEKLYQQIDEALAQ